MKSTPHIEDSDTMIEIHAPTPQAEVVPVAKPERPREYLTMVYLVRPGDEAGAITGRMDWCVATWGHVPDKLIALIALLEENDIEVPNELR